MTIVARDSGRILSLIILLSLPTVPMSAFAENFWTKTGRELRNAGRDINRAAINVGKAVERGVQDVGKGLDHLGGEINREFCDLMTLGKASKGEAGCNTSAGIGYDDQGTYTYDPSAPDIKYRGGEGSAGDANSTDKQLSQMAEFAKASEIETWEYEDQDVNGIARFLPPDTVLGEAWPNAATSLKPPTKSGQLRPCCGGGGGGFLATRFDKGKLRFHAGADYATVVREEIYSPISGWVERVKNPGKPGLMGLLLVNDKGYSASVFYIEPTQEIRDALARPTLDGVTKNRYKVEAGKTVIGYSQDLHPSYPANVPQHVHVTLTDPSGNPVSPDGEARIRKTPSDCKSSPCKPQ